MASILSDVTSSLKEVFSNRNIVAISSTNMLYTIFNGFWELWWGLYLLQVLNVSPIIIGFLATIQNTSRILFQLPGGMLADRIGRKKVIVLGTALRVISPIFLYFANSWYWVVPGIVVNACASIYMPAFNAIIAESLPQDKKGAGFGAYRFMTGIPGIFMPVVSGYYLDVMGIERGVKTGLLMFIVAAAVATIVRQIFLTETLVTEDPQDEETTEPKEHVGMIETFRQQPRTVWAMLAVTIITGFAMRMTWTFLSIYAVNVVDLSLAQYGMLQSVAMFISVPLYLVSGVVADRTSRKNLILMARGLGPFDSLSLFLFNDYRQLLGAYSVIGVAQGIGGGRLRTGGFMGGPAWNSLITDLVPAKDRGKVLGLMGTVSGLLGLPGAMIGGYVYDKNPALLLISGSLLEALAIPIIIFFLKDPKRDEIPPPNLP
ncbi:MFS transporter [Candidatus Bathyarchaeota archaeon]|nr:MFS transporter [Candidatus Bathyarchaeota archaeon]MBT4320397.1 MFS transporter [Candidatus Bathyarchaeota archaeon]MBT4423758.1 MFS transporter [Candidatus Bathyarchaeota archaeon]MBT6603597.1 MFS transporter [Candidatus Bathyarchaeota archaeon]MBT7186836.1 MFS transporter [Candidatus Bathyarchaeota archaeon]